MAPLNVPLLPAIQPNPPGAPPGSQESPIPVINVYTQQPNNIGRTRKPPHGGQRERGRPNPDPPGLCCLCGQTGHNRLDCPTNPWQLASRGYRRGELGSAVSRTSTRPSKPVERAKSGILGMPRESYRERSVSNFNN